MAASNAKPQALILAGGSGTRFWPVSQKKLPKQYLPLLGERSLIQLTVDRLKPFVDPRETSVCSTQDQQRILKEQLGGIRNFILEPEGRNTAPCLILSVSRLLQQGAPVDTPLVVLPADHFIRDVPAFHASLQAAIAAAREGYLVTLGIVPTSAHTGYGYIEAGDNQPGLDGVLTVRRFVEKPTRDRAEKFVQQKNFFWNSGIFIWTLGTIRDAFQRFLPEEWLAIDSAKTDSQLATAYRSVKPSPIDIAVMEKATNVVVIPTRMGWSDVGSWDAVYQLRAERQGENVVLSGQVITPQSHGCLVKVNPERQVAIVGVEDLVIIESGDKLLIARRSQDQLVREAAKHFDP